MMPLLCMRAAAVGSRGPDVRGPIGAGLDFAAFDPAFI